MLDPRRMSPLTILLTGAVLVIGVVLAISAPIPAVADFSQCPMDEILVKFQPGVDPRAVSERHGATILSIIPDIEVYVEAVPHGAAAAKIAEFLADPDVVYAEPNGVMSVPELGP